MEFNNNRLIAVMRLVMASSILLVFLFDFKSDWQSVALSPLVLLLCYTVFSFLLYLFEFFQRPLIPAITAHWVDVGWYTLLIAVSNNTNSIYLYGFFFSILIASFRWGFKSGLRVLLVSATLFILVNLIIAQVSSEISLNSFFVRSIFLVALGYMVAYWGGQEITLRRRLELLREVNQLSNPRFGVDRTISSVMERIRAFYGADVCIVITKDANKAEYRLRRADSRNPEMAVHVEKISDKVASQLISVSDCYGIVCDSGWDQWWRLGSRYQVVDVKNNVRVDVNQEEIESLSVALDSQSFITAPIFYRNEFIGRVFLTASEPIFEASDISFILQIINQLMPIIDNIQLVDRLALDAAESERQKIARDLHDSVIQPYIGLQIGLTAIRQKIGLGIDVSENVDSLLRMTSEEVVDLRRFISALKTNHVQSGNLIPAVQRFAEKFDKASGIRVHVKAHDDIRIKDRLAAEVFQIIAEGLSNVRRHTESQQALIELSCCNNCLSLQIKNDAAKDSINKSFTPRSIIERAASLGGRAHVLRDHDSLTIISVEIPL